MLHTEKTNHAHEAYTPGAGRPSTILKNTSILRTPVTIIIIFSYFIIIYIQKFWKRKNEKQN